MGYTLVIAEKPSVARDIARVLGCRERQDGYLAGGRWRVTWAIGHLVALCDPEEINEAWKRWRADNLPILPDVIPLKVLPKTRSQFRRVQALMRSRDCERLVCATDAGREGELIFRYLYQQAGCDKPFDRLWISSMTDEAIREGFDSLQPGSAYDRLYQSARCRSEADWLVGMNASRAFTLRYGALLSVGRVQTPTLAILVKRRHEIEAFQPRDYWVVTADFGDYTGQWLNEETGERRVYDQAQARDIARRTRDKPATVEAVTRERKVERPPLLYDLTSLQRDANRLLGFTAKKTLSCAQKLYETHKLLTYPRTDSRFLPRDMRAKATAALRALPHAYDALCAALPAEGLLPLLPRVFDNQKVTDHHAIVPTGRKADLSALPPDEAALFDLVVRRFLAAFYPDYRYDAVRVITRCEGEAFESLGREIVQAGWKVTEREPKVSTRSHAGAPEKALPPLAQGDRRQTAGVSVKAEKTRPPAPMTDASLLAAMEHAGREIEDETLRESMKDSGLGTPATRAAIIERLFQVGYARRKGRAIEATDKGVLLLSVVPAQIASPETTGRWEKALSAIAAGAGDPARFLEGIRRLAAFLVESAQNAPQDVVFAQEERRKKGRAPRKAASLSLACPVCGQGRVLENSKAFYCSRWREGCGFTLWKNCLVRAGGPELTPPLVERAFREGRLQGSTGVIVRQGASLRFEAAVPGKG